MKRVSLNQKFHLVMNLQTRKKKRKLTEMKVPICPRMIQNVQIHMRIVSLSKMTFWT